MINFYTATASQPMVVTLYEKQTLTNPYYIFRFVKQVTNEEKIFRAADTSSYTERYNKFLIELNTTEDLTQGVVNLGEGQWQYEVYESSTTTLSVQGLNKLENGICIVTDSTADITWVENSNNDRFYE